MKHHFSSRVIFIGMLFVSFLIVSNLTAFKVAEIHLTTHYAIHFPAALIFFPLTYLFDDILTEVYGFKMSRFIIWCGFACSALITFCTWVAVTLPASPVWDTNTNHGEAAYELIFKGSLRIFLASVLAYFFGEFLNSTLLAKLKVWTQGRKFALRVILSTAVGAGVDTIIFCHIAFFSVLPSGIVWEIILTQYFFKVAYECLMLPVTYSITQYLKKVEQLDYYDTQTQFNPFSLSLKQ